ncbi:MAG: substrate-binding domain-containing protein [Alphaproteobacteria bacterium]|nr:substrate-binding domain-containing protein [Alphaproteobacteria bacterium]
MASADQYRVVGTGDGMDVLTALSSAYMADNPGSIVVIPPSIGSGGGIAAVGTEKEVLGRIARPLSPTERQLGLVETPVFRLSSAIYVHPSVGITGLTSGQLRDIYAGEITNWSEVGGDDLRIKIVRREEADSTLLVLRQSMPGWDRLEITERSKMALTTQDSIEIVRNVRGALGFGPFTRLLEAELKVLTIDGRHPTNPHYPSAVTVSYIHKKTTVTPEATAIIAYARSSKAIALLQSIGAVPVVE